MAWRMDMRDWWICYRWKYRGKKPVEGMTRERLNELMERFPDD